jgi:uncharacterized coiled-coil DUF342 family protein
MSANTADLDTLNSECEELAEQMDAKSKESDKFNDQATKLGWEGEGEDSEKATELVGQSWGSYVEYLKLCVEYNDKCKAYDEAAGVLTDETTTLYEELDELYNKVIETSEAAEELCGKIAPLYTEEDKEDEIETLWEEHDEKEKEVDDLFAEITAKDEEIEAKTPEASDEESEDEES